MGKRTKSGGPPADDAVADLDAVLLAIEGAAELAWHGEFADKPSLVIIEVAAIIDLAAARLRLIVRDLDAAREG